MPRFYITTAIDYANGDPHLGHAIEKIGADVIARYRRLHGDDVHFLIGMDEHGQKVARTAADRGLSPQTLVDEVADRFVSMWGRLSISNDQFVRTTAPGHKDGVRALIERIFERNPDDFYEKAYTGWYCVGCEAFKQDAEIVDQRCVLHPTRTIEWVEERNWFFRLSRYTAFLKQLIGGRTDFLRPASRRNEMLALLEAGLEDVSASRPRLSWGVPFPRPTADGEVQTTYVWFDALPNYLTATGFPRDDYERHWPAQLHVVGKDITRFHTIIWPAMLQSAGLRLPERVWAHGFLSLGGERFSKSAGVTVQLGEAVDLYGPDALRYFLLREIPFDGDGSFSWERFTERYTADLANALGNLASRTMAMIAQYRAGFVPGGGGSLSDTDAADLADVAMYHAAMDGPRGYILHEGLEAVWRTVSRANEYVQRTAPWGLARDPSKGGELDAILSALVRSLARQAVCLYPFMPGKAEALWGQLGAPGSVSAQRFATLETLDVGGWQVKKGEGLFPRPSGESAK
ncbi:MAG: methionine--tRNA ligase [Gemmatimonadaceae bacterium]